MKVQLGNYELIYSTTIILIEDFPIQVTLEDEIEGNIEIAFRFTKDELNKGSITKTSAVDKFHLNIEFVNFLGTEVIGNINPLELGTLRKIPLYLNYRITSLRGTSRTMILNFYLRKEA
jgi:hypothetical protein